MFKLLSLAAVAATLSGCASALPEVPLGRQDPSNPYARTKAFAYRHALAGFQPHRPVEPLDWKMLNRRVTPGAGQ
ncbi:MAG: hypothetical protein KDJ29_07920 [Hyphomicrobiales bacterium]|nr:hypothetical protein [Hyphomicrobiales bacterium]